LSRCVSELLRLGEIEESFPGISAPDPYRFFAEHLDETKYLPQEDSSGVSVLPYRTAAPAPFDCHIVLGASQENLSEVFPRLAFLPRLKKEKLGLTDIDASKAFIDLHKLNSEKPAVFFCSRESFSGFAIPHAGLELGGKARMRYGDSESGAFAPDLFELERQFLSRPESREGSPAGVLHEVQAEGFRAFMERRRATGGGARPSGMEGRIFADLAWKRYRGEGDSEGMFRVSATAMEPFFRCAAEWFYARVLRLESVRMETSLMAENITGSLYHALLNRFFNTLMEKGGLLLPPDGEALPEPYRKILASAAAEVFESLPRLPGESRPLSALTVRFLRAGKEAAVKQTELFLAALLRYFGGFAVAGSEISYTLKEGKRCLTGKVDLLLSDEREGEAGGAAIVDFKLNYLPRRSDCTGKGERGLQDFQLPMYLSLAEANGCPPVERALFFKILRAEPLVVLGSIRDSLDGTEKPGRGVILRKPGGSREEGEDPFAAILAEFREKAGQYAEEAGTGNFSVFSTGEKQCAKCAYHRICRTLYTVERERGLIVREKTDG
ncbi:MAG: PD-(D/E)XK nuclease family protein, partial [Treponema sp.]|nr:PD-(D/E)XK nuclease family protein [Treponema sp.]